MYMQSVIVQFLNASADLCHISLMYRPISWSADHSFNKHWQRKLSSSGDTQFQWHLQSVTFLSSIDLAGDSVLLSCTVKTLGVTLDGKGTFRPHITNLCEFCFSHIIPVLHIRSTLTKNIVVNHSLLTCLLSIAVLRSLRDTNTLP